MLTSYPRVPLLLTAIGISLTLHAQPGAPKANDATTPLHLLQPDYPVPYGQPKIEDVTGVIRRIYTYLDANTPTQLTDKETKKDIFS